MSKSKPEYPWPVRIDLAMTVEQAAFCCAVTFILGIAVSYLLH